ncbi:MAG: uroporphyrinogen-III synthase [Acidimicrobiia bacterium]
MAITTDRFEAVAHPYALLGLEPVATPCIRFDGAGEDVLDRAREAASRAGLLLITSTRTIELLWPEQPMPDVAVAAVGERTAATVEAAGGRVVLTGTSGLAGLIEVAAERLTGARVVFPHAVGSDPVALELLRGLAPGLDEHEVYRTVPLAPEPTVVDAVAFASPVAVEGWLLARSFDKLVVGVIGSTTGTAVARHRPPDVVAPEPSHAALARALMSYLEVSV